MPKNRNQDSIVGVDLIFGRKILDWKKIIDDLMQSGLKQADIVRMTGISQSFISELGSGAKGKRVNWVIGNKLLSLHKEQIKHIDVSKGAYK